MTQNNNFSVLPWYKKIDLQNHRKSYAYGNIYPLFCETNVLLPFQIIRKTSVADISEVILYRKDGSIFKNITQAMKDAGLEIVKFEDLGVDVILFPARFPMNIGMLDGIYYLSLSDDVQIWYSEVFTAVNSVKGYLKIEWYDIENSYFDAGLIVYDNPRFKNFLYLCVELGKPDYQFEEEGEERDGYYFPEKRISEKTYKCTILAPEYLCDVMRLISLSDYIRVTDKYGQKYNCDTFLITPKWQTQGDLASVEIEFETNTVVKKLGRGIVRECIGDYDEKDYNEDYNLDNCDVTGNDLVVTPENIEVPATGGTYQVQIMTTGEWRFVKYDPSGWYVVDKPEGELAAIVNLTIEPNYTGAERTAVILIAGEDGDSATITVKQEAHSIKLSKKTLEYSATDTAAQTVSVESTTTWTTEIIQ